MSPDAKTARWKVILGYVAFSLFALVVGFSLTFPYAALKQRVQAEADAAGLYVKMGSLGPGFFGVTATNVQVSKKAAGDEEKPPEALVLESVSIRPSLFPLGVSVSASALGGSVSAAVGGLGDVTVRLTARDLDLSQGNLKGFSGVDLSGRASADLSLSIPKSTIGGARVAEPDLGQASGSISLDLSGVTVNGGTLNVVIPMYGPDPTPVDLPKIGLGGIAGKLKFEKGAGTIEELGLKGQGIEANATGTLKLAKRIEFAEPNVELRLKTEAEFLRSLGVYGVAFSQLPADPKDPSWRKGRLSGYLGRPSFR